MIRYELYSLTGSLLKRNMIDKNISATNLRLNRVHLARTQTENSRVGFPLHSTYSTLADNQNMQERKYESFIYLCIDSEFRHGHE